jgi:hypothetical protein
MRKLSLRPIFAWLRRKLLRKRVGLLAIGIGVPWLWLMWQFFGPLSAFPVSAETTIFTEPLTLQGYVDYVKIFQDRYQHPDAKPAKEDPWCLLAGGIENNPKESAGLPELPEFSKLLKAWEADHPDRACEVLQYMIWDGIPFPAVHDLGLAANGTAAAKKFLEDSEPWYAAVKNCEPTPPQIETFNPWRRLYPVEQYGFSFVVPIRSEWYANQIAGSFLFRAAMHFEAGSFAAGLDDLQIVQKAARNCERYCLDGYRRSLRTVELANEELINGLVLCPAIDHELARQLTQIPVTLIDEDEDVVKMLDEQFRLEALDQSQRLHGTSSIVVSNWVRVPPGFRAMATGYAAHRLNFDELLSFQNDMIDQICEAMRKSTYREQYQLINPLLAQKTLVKRPATADISFFSHDFQSHAKRLLAGYSNFERLPRDIASAINSRRVLHLAVRLARWRTINGHYPDSLDVLNSIPGLPPLPEGVLIDAFSNEPLRYELVGDRYQIRSAGEDIEFNDSLGNDETCPSKELLRPN